MSARKRAPQESATDRLARLLTMVPWLLARPGVSIEEAAAELAVTPEQLEADLALLFLCGTPGGMPDDLIEADWEDGRIFLGNADTLSRPLRLGRDEALALIVALRMLREIPGLTERDALDRTLVKLEEATSSAATPAVQARIQVDMAADDEATLATVRRALAERRRLHLTYLVAARDERTERDVDPMRLTSAEGRWYVEGWDHRSEDVRLFRLDRIEAAQLLDTPADPPEGARARDLDAGIFQPGPDDLRVRLELAPEAAWVADYYPHEEAEEGPGGAVRLTLRTADAGWLRRLLWRLGGAGRVLEPEWLAREVAEGARAALSSYGQDGVVH